MTITPDRLAAMQQLAWGFTWLFVLFVEYTQRIFSKRPGLTSITKAENEALYVPYTKGASFWALVITLSLWIAAIKDLIHVDIWLKAFGVM